MLKNKIESLIKLIKDTEINEIEVTSFWGAQRIRLSKGNTNSNDNYQESVKTQEILINEDKQNQINKTLENKKVDIPNSDLIGDNIETKLENYIEIKAPLVGTYYSSPRPEDPSFVNVGDKVIKGQAICIIEAMKIFNEIESEFSGTVAEILIDNGNPVEFDQTIIKIIPD